MAVYTVECNLKQVLALQNRTCWHLGPSPCRRGSGLQNLPLSALHRLLSVPWLCAAVTIMT